MNNYLTAFIGFFTETEYQWLILFSSAFLSATLLPGNSEIVFSAFVGQALAGNSDGSTLSIIILLISATLGNSLGSLTTYFLARLIPKPPLQQRGSGWQTRLFDLSQRYGVWVLLLSWLPLAGDLLCAIAGWLRFNLWASIVFITLGKLARYLIILVSLSIWLS